MEANVVKILHYQLIKTVKFTPHPALSGEYFEYFIIVDVMSCKVTFFPFNSITASMIIEKIILFFPKLQCT